MIPLETKMRYANSNEENLKWSGAEGNSIRMPRNQNSKVAKELSKRGLTGIEYKGAEPDFSPVSAYDFKFDDMKELFSNIGNIPIGKLDSRGGYNSAVRNTWQAFAKDKIVARIKNDPSFAKDFQKRTGINVGKVNSRSGLSKELSRVGLTLHETPDCSAIQFVPTSIHSTFKHSGGTAEMCEKLLSANTRDRVLGPTYG